MPKISTTFLDLLLKRGWFGKVDGVLLGLALSWPMLAWKRDAELVIGLLGCCVILLAWLLVLAYRIAYFVIILQVAFDAMPATSARLAVKFLKTGGSTMPGRGA